MAYIPYGTFSKPLTDIDAYHPISDPEGCEGSNGVSGFQLDVV